MDLTRESADRLASLAEDLKIRNIRRHIFLCADQTKPTCAPKEEGLESWNFLKKRLEELGLTKAEECVYRTKANCLRICHQGPIAVVYPEGVWYHSVTPEVLDAGTDLVVLHPLYDEAEQVERLFADVLPLLRTA